MGPTINFSFFWMNWHCFDKDFVCLLVSSGISFWSSETLRLIEL